MRKTFISIERRALLARINRRLKARGEQMFRTRGQKAAKEIGPWYIVSLEKRLVADSRLELETCARRLGALSEWERLAEPERAYERVVL
jgi:hypothetical protein